MAKDLFDMSDEELEAAFAEAKEERDSSAGTLPASGDDELDDNDDLDNDDADNFEEEEESNDDPDNVDPETTDDVNKEDTLEDKDKADAKEGAGKVSTKKEKVDTKADKTKVDDNAAASADVETAPTKLTFTANNEKYEFTEEEMKKAFPRVFGQAMDYTKKLQAIAPWRRSIDAIEQAGLSHQDVNLMIDAIKGDKDAIASVLKRNSIDTLDINTEDVNYTQKEYGRSNTELAIADVISSIKTDKEYVDTHRVITSDWDEASWKTLTEDPNKIQLLHTDVKSGVYAALQPEANKLKIIDGARRSDIEYYMEAARQHYQAKEIQEQSTRLAAEQERQRQVVAQTQVNQAKQQQAQREAVKNDASRRKAAAPTGRAAGRSTVTDYLSASDDDFNEWYAKLQETSL